MTGIEDRATNLRNQYTSKRIAEMYVEMLDELQLTKAANRGMLSVIEELQRECIAYRQNLSKSVIRRLDHQLNVKEKYEDKRQIILRIGSNDIDLATDILLGSCPAGRES